MDVVRYMILPPFRVMFIMNYANYSIMPQQLDAIYCAQSIARNL